MRMSRSSGRALRWSDACLTRLVDSMGALLILHPEVQKSLSYIELYTSYKLTIHDVIYTLYDTLFGIVSNISMLLNVSFEVLSYVIVTFMF
jgi:hypothetical protein